MQHLTTTEAQTAMMRQFWQAGYGQTTVADLAAASQQSRSQFYRTYHSKAVALRRCLQLYDTTLAAELTARIRQDHDRQVPLAALLADCLLTPFQSDHWPAGCLMVNLMAELGNADPLVGDQLQTVYTGLQTRLVGLLAPIADQLPATVAEVATSLMQVRSGLQLLAKQGAGATQLKRQAQTSVQLILGED